MATRKSSSSRKTSKSLFLTRKDKDDDYIGWDAWTVREMMTSKEWKKFKRWIVGQTCPLMPNGNVGYFKWDVRRFLESSRSGVPTFWD